MKAIDEDVEKAANDETEYTHHKKVIPKRERKKCKHE
jgi:hypothetical protein